MSYFNAKTVNSNQTKSSLIALCGALMCVSVGLTTLTGCEKITADPMQQTIPTSADKWQDKLGDTFNQLSEEDRQLLSRYMLRMKLSGAYDSGAMPRTTIADALKQQREYEALHPDNPTGKKSPIDSTTQSPDFMHTYPITLLPIQQSSTDELNNVKLQFMLENKGMQPIESFTGNLMMQAANFNEGMPINVPLTTFSPPIAPDASGKLAVDSSIEDMNVIRAIKDPQAVSVQITQGTIHLQDGQTIDIEQTLEGANK